VRQSVGCLPELRRSTPAWRAAHLAPLERCATYGGWFAVGEPRRRPRGPSFRARSLRPRPGVRRVGARGLAQQRPQPALRGPPRSPRRGHYPRRSGGLGSPGRRLLQCLGRWTGVSRGSGARAVSPLPRRSAARPRSGSRAHRSFLRGGALGDCISIRRGALSLGGYRAGSADTVEFEDICSLGQGEVLRSKSSSDFRVPGLALVIPEPFHRDPHDYVIQAGQGIFALHSVLTEVLNAVSEETTALDDPVSYANLLHGLRNLSDERVLPEGSVVVFGGADAPPGKRLPRKRSGAQQEADRPRFSRRGFRFRLIADLLRSAGP
jgi:hypothetical protein